MTNRFDSLIGIPWYRPQRYNAARRRMADAALLPASYEVWLERAEQRENETRSSGATPNRVYVDDDVFATYCAEKNIVLDSKARARYAADFCASTFKANVPDYGNPGFWPGPIPRRKRT